MKGLSTNVIEKQILIEAPVSKVWDAIIDHEKFGEWFRVVLESPFEEGRTIKGRLTYPGYEHVSFEFTVKQIQPEKLFSYTWHPYAVDTAKDYSTELPTLVEFKLEAIDNGTRLTVTESGFDALPPERRDEAYRMNEGGWEEQVQNVDHYVCKG